MCRNNKNARLQKMEEALPKNRSAAAKARRAEGKVTTQGRATAPKHTKRNAWWQRKGMTYAMFIKGGAKPTRKTSGEDAGALVEIVAA